MSDRPNIDFFIEAARKKTDKPSMPWVTLEAMSDTVVRVVLQDTDGVKTRGPNKGSKRYVGPKYETYVALEEAEVEERRWLSDGGVCTRCLDKKEVCVGWGADGERMLPCQKCRDRIVEEIRNAFLFMRSREVFTDLYADVVEFCKLTDDEAAKLFDTTLPIARRWREGAVVPLSAHIVLKLALEHLNGLQCG